MSTHHCRCKTSEGSRRVVEFLSERFIPNSSLLSANAQNEKSPHASSVHGLRKGWTGQMARPDVLNLFARRPAAGEQRARRDRGLRAIRNAETLEDDGQLILHGARGEPELARDVL